MLASRAKGPLASRGHVPAPDSDAHLCDESSKHSHLKPAKALPSLADDVEHRKRLERRLQAQLKDGSRSRTVKRLSDPLVKHLLRVAGNAPYRNLRRSVIVTGKTLICELLTAFPCRRLALRRQGIAALRSCLPHLNSLPAPSGEPDTDFRVENRKDQFPIEKARPENPRTFAPLNSAVEKNYVSNRILRKVAGFHSYDDGCIAEMRMPEPADDLGNIQLLLCLGRLPSAFGQARLSTPSNAEPTSLSSGAIGTLIRTSAALQWQGAWVLPSCPDIFNPLAIRASQGALFWLPYCRGGVDDLMELCRAKDLAVCVPHKHGISVRTSGIFEERKKKGVCLVLDDALQKAAEVAYATLQAGRSMLSTGASSLGNEVRTFKPDMYLSLGSEVAPEKSMELLHPITVASLLIYHIKHVHFPTLRGSPYIFLRKQRP